MFVAVAMLALAQGGCYGSSYGAQAYSMPQQQVFTAPMFQYQAPVRPYAAPPAAPLITSVVTRVQSESYVVEQAPLLMAYEPPRQPLYQAPVAQYALPQTQYALPPVRTAAAPAYERGRRARIGQARTGFLNSGGLFNRTKVKIKHNDGLDLGSYSYGSGGLAGY
jgi:hypothetical protein